MVQFYELQLVLLTGLCLFFLTVEHYASKNRKPKHKELTGAHLESGSNPNAFAALTRQYLVVYAIVMGADWLQGPYIYSLYREQYQFPERVVALLFVTGFVSAGLTAPLIGVWADQHGRKKLCLAFCITYTMACVCVVFRWLPTLLFGRILGGISTSILFSAFESWLISSSSSLALSQTDLSTIMGRATLINGFVATGAGVVSNQLVSLSNTFVSPFIASAALLCFAFVVIRGTWTENYGSGGGTKDSDTFQIKRLGQASRIVGNDSVLLVLGLTQTCFEGSMYLFVFLWVPSLQEFTQGNSSYTLPLGYIFSSFMISMMLGSLLYSAIVSRTLSSASRSSTETSLTLHAKLSSMVCAVGAAALATSISSDQQHVRFWAFCVFEACVGMYYPVQGMLRGSLIANEHRATLSSLFRVPLNVFVVVSLMTGVSHARYAVLTASSLMLAFSSLMTGAFVLSRVDEAGRETNGRTMHD